MEALDQKNIQKGRQKLLVSLVVLTLSSLLFALVYWTESKAGSLYSDYSRLNWTLPLMVALMGVGTFRGSKPVKWIFAVLLILALAFQIYLFNSIGLPEGFAILFFALTLIGGGLTIYMVMIDGQVEDFLLAQRSKNFGEFIPIAAQAAEPPKPKPAPKGVAALEEEEDVEILEEKSSKPKKPRKASKSSKKWEDELGIFDEED